MSDETNLRCADTVINARFSCDLCSLVGLLLSFDLGSRFYRKNRAPLRKGERAQGRLTFDKPASSQFTFANYQGQEGGSGELLLQ